MTPKKRQRIATVLDSEFSETQAWRYKNRIAKTASILTGKLTRLFQLIYKHTGIKPNELIDYEGGE